MKFAALIRDSQHVSDMDWTRGLGDLISGFNPGLNPAEIAGFGCKGPRFKETRSPEPLVDSYGGVQVIFLPALASPRR